MQSLLRSWNRRRWHPWRPPKTGKTGTDRCKTFSTHHLAGLQESFATSLHKVDAGHYLTPKPLYRLVRARGQHYIAGIDGALAPTLRFLISVSQPVLVRRVDTALYPLRTRPFGEAAITSFIACPTKPRNSPARGNGTVPSPTSTNSFVSGWLRSAASSLSGAPARQSAKVKAVLSELMHQRPMLPSPTEPDCSTTVTPSFRRSARRPRLCAASRGASPPGPPPIMATPVRPKLNVTYSDEAQVTGNAIKNLRGG